MREPVRFMYFTQGTAELFLGIYSKSIFLVIDLLSSWFSGFLLQGSTGEVAGLSTRGTHPKVSRSRSPMERWDPKLKGHHSHGPFPVGDSRPHTELLPSLSYSGI